MKLYILLFLLLSLASFSCNKQNEFLSAIPNEALAVPSTLNQLQLLLQDDNLFNRVDPYYGTVSADEYYATESNYLSSSPVEQNLYTWSINIYPSQSAAIDDWNIPYQQVFAANTVLDALAGVTTTSVNQVQYNTVKGSALFFRAKAFFMLLEEFSAPFDSTTASTELGIPLPLTANINNESVRVSEKDCYDQITSDLTQAISLLPTSVPQITSPTDAAAKGFLARVLLAMREYSQASEYANAYLSEKSTLTNYNNLTIGAFPIENANTPLIEDIFHSTAINGGICGSGSAIIDSNLYNSYDSNDLRKYIFFWFNNNNWSWNGTYDVIHGNDQYDGVATDELYLIRAECEAREGNIGSAITDLNILLINRYSKGKFTPITTTNADTALSLVLKERRKELIYRGIRWYDLRRLNMESGHETTLTRSLNGTIYTLPPNDPRYVLPIPYTETSLSGIQQNPR